MLQLILIFFCSINAFAQVDHEKLSTQVIELRKEVELLNDDYKSEREKVLSDIKGLSLQKAELEAKIRSEKVRRKQLLSKIDQIKSQLNEISVQESDLLPVLNQSMTDLEAWINRSLPFKKQERLDAVISLREKIEKKEVSPVKAANQLWALFEDEKRLARETSLHRQTLPIENKMQLAEVVKLGMLKLYFKTEDNRVGLATTTQDDQPWKYVYVSDPDQEKQILAFFESLKKQIRQGYFELPTKI